MEMWKIPVWTNIKTIEEGDELVCFQGKRKADSVVVAMPEDDEPEDAGKKKTKKSGEWACIW